MSKGLKPHNRDKSTLDLFREAWPPRVWLDVTCLVGVSGGADSVALLRLMHAIGAESTGRGTLMIAHFDHGWREESADDAEFVAALADELGLPCVVGRAADEAADDVADAGVGRSEERARASRYAFLTRVAKQHGARFIAVAHTADDQVETILHHAIRGSGLRGLAGVPNLRSIDESLTLVRPLLGLRRTQLVAYLRSIGQAYCTDLTNLDSKYTRARIRYELLPHLREYNTEVEASILRLGKLASEASFEISRVAEELLNKALLSSTPKSAVISLSQLTDASPFLVREMFVELWRRQSWPMQAMAHKTWVLLAAMAGRGDSEYRSKAADLPSGLTVRRATGQLEIRYQPTSGAPGQKDSSNS